MEFVTQKDRRRTLLFATNVPFSKKIGDTTCAPRESAYFSSDVVQMMQFNHTPQLSRQKLSLTKYQEVSNKSSHQKNPEMSSQTTRNQEFVHNATKIRTLFAIFTYSIHYELIQVKTFCVFVCDCVFSFFGEKPVRFQRSGFKVWHHGVVVTSISEPHGFYFFKDSIPTSFFFWVDLTFTS